ncbi:hypothetical protein RN001_005286 [Aquatica leii]|uniref:Carbonic anhydrase n=1 Tax=Aquatica leii TaxID=1421715 RepID=A0AAN7PBQ6_9COLE|nr:hypothetical protein RN001_005286 [Aquatica leii]
MLSSQNGVEKEKKKLYGGFESGLEWIQRLAARDGLLQSPINISLSFATPLQLELLQWNCFEIVPKKLKLTNTGRTLQISASWFDEKPTLCGGPLNDVFEFSQLHFHWGAVDMEGSEHTVDDVKYPLEMHVVFFKSEYLTHEAALKQKDGVTVLVYLFQLHAGTNIVINYVLSKLFFIGQAVSSARLSNIPLQFFLKKFEEDYFLYWGSVVTATKSHSILWLICREPIEITLDQMASFRLLLNSDSEPMLSNYRTLQPLGKRRLFHICPSTVQYASMLPVSRPDETMINDFQFITNS